MQTETRCRQISEGQNPEKVIVYERNCRGDVTDEYQENGSRILATLEFLSTIDPTDVFSISEGIHQPVFTRERPTAFTRIYYRVKGN